MTPRKVLLIGWDAADWKVIQPLMDAGKMPHVRRLVQDGVIGQIATLHPPLSPMLWTSIATGKRPFKHGIHGFTEPTPDGRGVQPVTNLSRKSKAIWNILNQNHLRSVVIGWWPSHPAEPIDGVMVSDHFHRAGQPLDQPWPLPENTIHPPELAGILADLRVHPDRLTPELVETFIPLAREIDQDNDNRLAAFLRTLAECMSIYAAAAWLLEKQSWDFFAVYFDAIDHFCHAFMRYHPPRQPWIGARDFELYSNVVSMAYQFHDRMLGAMLKKAGEDTTIILMSDHGFHPDRLRPSAIPDVPAGPAIEHRDFGIFAISGPGIRKGELLHGASVLDVTPTILTLYGLPAGEDMDGRVLSQAFEKTRDVVLIPSWEQVAGADGCHPPHTRLDPEAAREALERMIALGYIEPPDESRQAAVEKTIRELRYNLGEAYQDDDRHMEAYEIFSALHAADPDEQRFAVRLFVSCQALELHEEMRRIVDDLDGRRRALFEEAKAGIEELRHAAIERAIGSGEPDGPIDTLLDTVLTYDEQRDLARWRNLARCQPLMVEYLKSQVLTAEKRYGEALAVLERVTQTHLMRPGPLLQTADLYLRLHRWRDAQRVYEMALAIDPDNAHAHLGKCRLALRRRRFDAAAQSALEALQRIYRYPQAHFLLGVALTGRREYERAAEAFRAAINFNPNFPEAHRGLAALLGTRLGDAESAREHRRLARRMEMRGAGGPDASFASPPRAASTPADTGFTAKASEMPAIEDSLIVVTGLPRSGTSMLMQMLAAGGLATLSDGLREADEDNPRGYFELDRMKNLPNDSAWLFEGRGKAVKIVAPLLGALPPGLPCRVILSERDLEEVLDSQERMLRRRNQTPALTPHRRQMLKDEYIRTLLRVKEMLGKRPATELLVVQHRDTISDSLHTADNMNRFLGGALDVLKMAAAIDPALHRNRAGPSRPAAATAGTGEIYRGAGIRLPAALA